MYKEVDGEDERTDGRVCSVLMRPASVRLKCVCTCWLARVKVRQVDTGKKLLALPKWLNYIFRERIKNGDITFPSPPPRNQKDC